MVIKMNAIVIVFMSISNNSFCNNKIKKTNTSRSKQRHNQIAQIVIATNREVKIEIMCEFVEQ